MPVVFWQGSVIVRIYAPLREHPPPHVQVIFRGLGEVVVEIGTSAGGPRIHRDYGVPAHLLLVAYHLVEDHQAQFQNAWEGVHGRPTSD